MKSKARQAKQLESSIRSLHHIHTHTHIKQNKQQQQTNKTTTKKEKKKKEKRIQNKSNKINWCGLMSDVVHATRVSKIL